MQNKELNKLMFEVVPGFKEWIEQTKLFVAIKEAIAKRNSNFSSEASISIHSNEVDIDNIPRGVIIEVAEDLPTEIIKVFYSYYFKVKKY